jgi:hypothetical protein
MNLSTEERPPKIYFDRRVFGDHAETLARLLTKALPAARFAVGPVEESRWTGKADDATLAEVHKLRRFLAYARHVVARGERCRSSVDAAADLLLPGDDAAPAEPAEVKPTKKKTKKTAAPAPAPAAAPPAPPPVEEEGPTSAELQELLNRQPAPSEEAT